MEDAEDIRKARKESYNREDKRERNLEKEKEKEKKKALDEDLELEVISKTIKQKERPKIVGLGFKVLGPFTKRFVENFLNTTRALDPNEVNEKGFFQAQELAKKGGVGKSGPSSRNL